MFSGLACKTHIAHIAQIARTRGRVEPTAGTFLGHEMLLLQARSNSFFARFCAEKMLFLQRPWTQA